MRSYWVWIAQQAASQFDRIDIEQSDHFPPKLFVKHMMGAGYGCVWCVFCPSEIGFPAVRRRFYGSAFLHKTFTWCGETYGNCRAEFMNMFRKDLLADGDVFAGVDTQENRIDAAADLMGKQFKGKLTMPDEDDLEGLCGEGGMEKHLECYKQLYLKKAQSCWAESAHEADERIEDYEGCVAIADLSQNPDKRNRMSNLVPTVQRSTKLVSLSKKKVFTASEIEASQGVPGLVPADPVDSDDDVASELCNLLPFNGSLLTVSQRREFSGNAMHLGAAGAWQLFVSSNLMRRSTIQEFAG